MDDSQVIGNQEAIANGYNGSSDFSIITDPPSPSNGNGDQVGMDMSTINIALYNSLQSHTSDMSLEEAVSRVQALMKENQELKVVVEQSNATMNQLSTSLIEWRATQEAEQEKVKHRLEQTKNVVLDLRSQKQELTHKVKHLENEVTELKAEVDKRTEAVEVMEEEKQKWKVENEMLERLVEEHKMEAAEYKRRLETTPLSLDHISAGPADTDMEAKLNSLQNKFDDAVVYKTKSEKLEIECSSYRDMVANLESKLAEVRDSSTKLRDENQDLRKKEARLRELVRELETQINAVKQINQKLDQEKHDLVVINTQLQSHSVQQGPKVTQQHSEVQRAAETSQNGGTQLQQQLQEEKLRNEDLKARLSDQKELIERLTSERNRKEQQMQNASVRYMNTMKELKNSHQVELQQLQQEISTLSRSQGLLEQQKESVNSQRDDINSLKAQNLALVSDVREQESKKMAASKKVDALRSKNEELEKQVKQLQKQLEEAYAMDDSVVQVLNKSSQAMEQQLTMEKQSHNATKAQFAEMKNQYHKLIADYNEVTEELKSAQLTVPPSYSEDVFRQYQEQLDNLTGQVMLAEETINSKNQEVRFLKEKLSRSLPDMETVPVLQAQCDIYKTDFEAERAAREKMHTDNCRLHAEIQQLQIRNQQLQDEMENYSKKQLEDMQRTYARQNWSSPNNTNTLRGSAARVTYPGDFDDGSLVHVGVNSNMGPGMADFGLGMLNTGQTMAGAPAATVRTRDHDDVSGRPATPKQARGPTEQQEVELICPKCFIECPDMDSLNIHVLDCLDQR